MSLFTSESVSEGHPDKVADYIADSILDAHLAQDPQSRVACEVLCKDDLVLVAGEITSSAQVDLDGVVRNTVREIGYTNPDALFNAEKIHVQTKISRQSPHISQGVDQVGDLGAGDQGMVFGFATRETEEGMPLPVSLAHRLTHGLASARHTGAVPWLCPDAKAQVTVRYEGNGPVEVTDVVVSTQHADGIAQDVVCAYVTNELLPQCLGSWHRKDIRLFINPTGAFAIGGPEGDCGVTGRKIIVDTYGGYARHGGGAFSGKDATKVDRSAAYFARYVARKIVQEGIADCAELQVAYAIGVAQPVSISVDTRGTGDAKTAEAFARQFDYRPAAIIEQLDLLQPIYRQTTNYGHFGKAYLAWEK